MNSPRRHGEGHRQDRSVHALLLAAAVAVPVFGLVLSTDTGGHVSVAGIEALRLPTLCPSRWLGFRCPTCGVTRSVIALMAGDMERSLQFHRFGWLIFLLIVSQVPYRAWRLLRPEARMPAVERAGMISVVLTGAIVVLNRIWEISFPP